MQFEYQSQSATRRRPKNGRGVPKSIAVRTPSGYLDIARALPHVTRETELNMQLSAQGLFFDHRAGGAAPRVSHPAKPHRLPPRLFNLNPSRARSPMAGSSGRGAPSARKGKT